MKMTTRETREIIVYLFDSFRYGVARVTKTNNKKNPHVSHKAFNEYVETLPADKRDMIRAIRDFRNHCAHGPSVPKLPDNYQEWIELLTNEISKLKEDK